MLLGGLLGAVLVASSAAAHQVESAISCPIPENEPVFVPASAYTQPPSCTLSSQSDTDSFSIFVFAGTRFRIALASASDHLDPRLVVRDAPGLIIHDQSCDGGSVAAPSPRCGVSYELVAPETAEYFATVSDEGEDEAGDYHLQVEELPGAVDDLIDRDSFNDFNTLDVPTDLDHHRVIAEAGQWIEVEMISCGAHMDPRIEAWSPSGAKPLDVHCATPDGPFAPTSGLPVECADELPEREDLCTALGVFEVTESGEQRISLSDAGSNGPGRYDVTIRRVPEPTAKGLSGVALVAVALARQRRARRAQPHRFR